MLAIINDPQIEFQLTLGYALVLKESKIDKPEAKAQSKAQSPKRPQKGKRGIWPLG